MIAFRGDGAELLLKPTSSVELAKKCLEEMPTGGRTPLAHGLLKGLETIKNESFADHGMLPVLVLVTDGKANVPLQGGKPVDEALDMAGKLAQERYTVMVLDTENDFINLGLAQKVAEASGAQYFKLDYVSADNITGLVKGAL
jgi:magnesium chelatase subunit D